MDNRLTILGGRQVVRLSVNNLAELSAAVTAVLCGGARTARVSVNHMELLHIFSSTQSVYLDLKDWAKIVDLMGEDSFLTPTRGTPHVKDASALDLNYSRQYAKVETSLRLLFTETYPNPQG